eukprot:TRINITY_DN2326_c0_g1_i1.p1 TRINITY_DN2326_c0_g1~~TRINITY_DN2326_c0_g1_i1.p1  ORF type:complete len:148 (+),score=5.92 TRINITY_DN2326_c0_g1_i1:87-530(+)
MSSSLTTVISWHRSQEMRKLIVGALKNVIPLKSGSVSSIAIPEGMTSSGASMFLAVSDPAPLSFAVASIGGDFLFTTSFFLIARTRATHSFGTAPPDLRSLSTAPADPSILVRYALHLLEDFAVPPSTALKISMISPQASDSPCTLR